MAHTSQRRIGRERRKRHIRKTVRGNAHRPRLCVFRSAKHIYAQIIDDSTGVTLVAASSLKDESGSTKEGAKVVGARVGALAKEKNIVRVVFDRNGYLYHGRVAALADGAREAGLDF